MKDLKYYLGFIMLAFCVLFVACSDDDDKAVKPVFPQLQKLECSVGDEKALSFEATGNWTLTSSALWCTFVVDGENVHSCSGTAGQQTVNIFISDDATALLKSYKAELKLMMGGEQQVIFEVTRPTTGYELHAFNADQTMEYTVENPYVQDYAEKGVIQVTANADWAVEGTVSLDLSNTNTYGLAGDVVQIKPTLKPGFEHRKETWEQELIFKNKEGEVIAKLPVHYDGIPADKVEFSNDNPSGTTITFAYNGYSYMVNSNEADAPMPLSVAARDNKYTLVYVEYTETRNDLTWEYEYECTRMSEEESWFFADDDKEGNLSIYMTQNGGIERKAYLLVFPNEVYEAVKADFDNLVFSTSEGIRKEYIQYMGARLDQEANPKFSKGFDIADGEGTPLYDNEGMVIEPVSYLEVGELSEDELIEKYGTSNVYILSLPLEVSYENIIAKPRGFTGYYLQGIPNVVWDGVEVIMYSMLETQIVGIGASTTGNDMMSIGFMDPNGEMYAVLLIARYPI